MTRNIIIGAALALMIGAGSAYAKDKGEEIVRETHITKLGFIGPGDQKALWDILRDTRANLSAEDIANAEKYDGLVSQACGFTRFEPTEKLGVESVITYIIAPIVKGLFGLFSKDIDKELQKYVATYEAERLTPMYAEQNGNIFEPAWNCFRFERIRVVLIKSADGSYSLKQYPEFDFLGQMHFSNDGPSGNERTNAVQFRPLRATFVQGQARGKKVSVAVNVAADAVWLDGDEGKANTVFDHTIFKHSFTKAKDGKAALHYAWRTVVDTTTARADSLKPEPVPGEFQEWIKGNKRLPLLPWSTNSAKHDARYTFRVSAAESGTDGKKGFLKLLKAYLDDNGETLADGVTAAIKGTISDDAAATD